MKFFKRSLFPALKRALLDERIIVLTGMRQVGKTTTLMWLLDQVASVNKIYLDLDRLDQRAVFDSGSGETVLGYLRSHGLDLTQPLTVALDEIQNSPALPGLVKTLYEQNGIHFLLACSSPFYLKSFFNDSLAGRKVVYEMSPLGFGEFLDFHNVTYQKQSQFEEMLFQVGEYERLKSLYEEYMAFGGFPGVVLAQGSGDKVSILNDILSSYMNIDVRAMSDFRKTGQLQQLLRILAMRIGRNLDPTRLAQLVGISRPTLNEYLGFLEQTGMIIRLPAYTGMIRAASPGRKVYFRDNGLASVLANPGEEVFFENALVNQLSEYGELAFLETGSFLLTPARGTPAVLEMSFHPLPSDVFRLQKTARKMGFSQSWLVGKHPVPGFEDFLWAGSFF